MFPNVVCIYVASLLSYPSGYIIHQCRYQIPENWPYQEARRLFKEPVVSDIEGQPEIKWTAPDEEVIFLIIDLSTLLC